MTAPEETKEKVAAVGFVAFMAAAAGPVGLVIAAFAVGLERAWNGDAGRDFGRDSAKQRAADHRQWLAEDRAHRERLRADRKAWLDAGADPEKRPKGPSGAARFGRALRRGYARAAVAAQDFRDGFRDGLAAAKDERAAGGSFRDIVRARPDRPDADRLDWSDVKEPMSPATPPPVDDSVRADPEPEPKPSKVRQPEVKPDVESSTPPPPASPDNTRGEPVSTQAATVAQRGEANHVAVTNNLNQIAAYQNRVDELVDAAEAQRRALEEQTRRTQEHAQASGQPAATLQALDAALAYLKQMGRHLSEVSTGNAQTTEQVGAADGGLNPVRQADDQIRTAGADHRSVAPASGV